MAEFSTGILVGSPIPLTLQLDDGAAGLYPRVTITDDLNQGVDVVPLTDQGFGLYTGNSINPMPDRPWVVAQFVVYTDSLYQNIATNYSIEIERFDRVDPDDFKGEFEQVNIGERVFGQIIEQDAVVGRLSQHDKVIGVVEDIAETQGKISSDGIETKVTDNTVVEGEI